MAEFCQTCKNGDCFFCTSLDCGCYCRQPRFDGVIHAQICRHCMNPVDDPATKLELCGSVRLRFGDQFGGNIREVEAGFADSINTPGETLHTTHFHLDCFGHWVAHIGRDSK